jgi:chaperonin GroES
MLPGDGRYTPVMPRTNEGAAKAPSKTAAKTAARSKRPRARTAVGSPDIRLTGDRLVVRIPGNGERKSASGLLIPATAAPAPRRLIWADVELTGPDVRVAKQGDRVLFLPSSGLEVELDGEDLVLLRERDVQAVAAGSTDPKSERQPGQYL